MTGKEVIFLFFLEHCLKGVKRLKLKESKLILTKQQWQKFLLNCSERELHCVRKGDYNKCVTQIQLLCIL